VAKGWELLALILRLLERYERRRKQRELQETYDEIGEDVIRFTDRELGGRVLKYRNAAEAYEARAAARKDRS
jgi:hypothetical protein